MNTHPDSLPPTGNPEDLTHTLQIPGATLGALIGPYRLVRQIGEGGMGVVYHAQQIQPIRRDVALKIIKPGMDSRQVIARFESERQAVAIMDHPNIARVFDAGTTAAGLPYFVMELVAGVPITNYCDAKRLTLRERIELFLPVCRAIQHAHQKGIIHRDIKPSNVLIAESEGKPVPKVIDFGLAKALGQQLSNATMMTDVGAVVGTLEYMSPEQADPSGTDVDTRSDVYSLGAVFYELLTGATPLEREGGLMKGGYLEALRYIRDHETPIPSARFRRSATSVNVALLRQSDEQHLPLLLSGELDWIAMKALEKDRALRYETVNALMRDCERYLAGEPVEAAPPSVAYRVRKFAAKHRRWLATAGAFALLLIVAVVVSTVMAIRATRAEKAALRDRNVAAAVNDFLQNDLLAQASAANQLSPDGKPDPDLKVRTVLDRSAAHIEGKFRSQPDVEASVRLTMGSAYLDLGLHAEALRQLQRAVEIRRQFLGPEHPDTLASLRQLGVVYREQGKYPEAEGLYTRLLDSDRRVLGKSHPETLRSVWGLAQVLDREGKYPEAEKLAREALEKQRQNPGPESPDTLETTNLLASIYTEEGKFKEAEHLFLNCLELDRRLYGPDHPATLSTMSDLSVLYSIQKKHIEAEALKAKTLEASQRILGPEHPYTLKVMSNLAVTYSDEQKYAESLALNRQTVEIMRRVLGPEHPSTLIAMNNLGVAYKSLGQYADALPLDKQVMESSRKLLGENHPSTLASRSNLGLDFLHLGEFRDAEVMFRKLLEVRRSTLGPKDPSVLRTSYHLAWSLYREGRNKEAEQMLREDLRIYDAILPGGWEQARCQNLLGATLLAQKKYAEAEPLLLKGADGLQSHKADIAWYAKEDPDFAIRNLVDLYKATGKPDRLKQWQAKLK